MELQLIDHLACNKDSLLHRASLPSKLVGLGLSLAAVVLTRRLPALGIMVLLQGVILFALAPSRLIRPFAIYPLVFTGLFALSQIRSAPMMAALVVLKGEAAALILLALAVSTPFNQLFRLARRFPPLVRDSILLTYRGFFILLERLECLRISNWLRGGLGLAGNLRNLRRMAQSAALLTISSLDLAERVYRVMELRGYDGVLCTRPIRIRPKPVDLVPVLVGLAFLSLGVLL